MIYHGEFYDSWLSINVTINKLKEDNNPKIPRCKKTINKKLFVSLGEYSLT